MTRLLVAIEQGDRHAAEELLPLIYDELRKLAAQKLAREKPGQTLQATALVHEAYLRLVDSGTIQMWESRAHFFAAAAEAMRRILVERARRKKRRSGGTGRRLELEEIDIGLVGATPSDDLLALDEALEQLAQKDPIPAQVVMLRYFAGLSLQEAAKALGIPLRTAERNWTYARTWLHRAITRGDETGPA